LVECEALQRGFRASGTLLTSQGLPRAPLLTPSPLSSSPVMGICRSSSPEFLCAERAKSPSQSMPFFLPPRTPPQSLFLFVCKTLFCLSTLRRKIYRPFSFLFFFFRHGPPRCPLVIWTLPSYLLPSSRRLAVCGFLLPLGRTAQSRCFFPVSTLAWQFLPLPSRSPPALLCVLSPFLPTCRLRDVLG